MDALWRVQRADGTRLGPYSALEVRDALREGVVDPFDLVFREGSTVKQPLIEIDELFLSAQHDSEAKVDSVYEVKDSEKTLVANDRSPKNNMSSSPHAKENIRSNQRRQAKKYYIIDQRSRIHGPLSAMEIQSLFYRGLIPRASKVTKSSGSAMISIEKFVSAYAGAQLENRHGTLTRFEFFENSQGYALSKPSVLKRINRAALTRHLHERRKFILEVGILIAIAIIVLGGALFLKSFRRSQIRLVEPIPTESPLDPTPRPR